LNGADEVIRKMERAVRRHDVPPFVTDPMAARQARIWLAQDKAEAAWQWVRERQLDAEGGPTLLHDMEYLVTEIPDSGIGIG
jgi:hypothetical protein